MLKLLNETQHEDDTSEFDQQGDEIVGRAEVVVRHILTIWKPGRRTRHRRGYGGMSLEGRWDGTEESVPPAIRINRGQIRVIAAPEITPYEWILPEVFSGAGGALGGPDARRHEEVRAVAVVCTKTLPAIVGR